jgi:electron transport complex protein RnfE
MNSLWNTFKKGLIEENPVFVLALSLCPALAVTASAITSLTMGLSVMFVITANNCAVSITRKLVNPKVRVPVYIVSIATIVTVVQLVLQAFAPALYKALGIYLALVVVFAIILARAEVFASKNKLIPSFFDGLGMGAGFCLALFIIGCIREILGNGSIFGVQLISRAVYDPALIFILPAGGFILIGYMVAAWKMLTTRMEKKKAERGEA